MPISLMCFLETLHREGKHMAVIMGWPPLWAVDLVIKAQIELES